MAYRKLGRNSGHRGAMLRNIVTSLLRHERIETTEARAKELSSIAEKMITLGKQGDLAARRLTMSYLMDEDVVKKLFDTIAPKYADRQGGYTRIMKLGMRRGDAATMVIVELV
ncbi:LSU ribosomal protein L17P [Desulfosporosinus acidiphilus SJ4]|uniref:Large ribosomal subunit protein bL17 n=1 Tax=Desulfosporosinus acidiphilus (strain DSM 22704 / JCM 16185 / SJ4) TaxID=646529 RepID=I4D1B1_DESAJ|nr:50S ribosomal protein L17 [Desulfosporosinus acidiphilus]AFM39585.1 LSU ribosomal protein L17P [Desulfosporosinus acidiphilus SJ4]